MDEADLVFSYGYEDDLKAVSVYVWCGGGVCDCVNVVYTHV